jgi:uncharacterized protein with PQ loop repeat
MTGGVLFLCAITELSLILGIRQIRNDHTKDIVLTFFGILASVILAVALFPQYWEIYKLQAVVGISLLFLTIDILGGVFFDLSLVFKEEFDVIAGVQYSVVVVRLSVSSNHLTQRQMLTSSIRCSTQSLYSLQGSSK